MRSVLEENIMRWIILVTFVYLMESAVEAAKLADIHWNATNPMFRIDNTDHIIDVNKGNIPFEYDQVNIICPAYNSGTREEDVERYIIYNVSKEEYDSCRITNPTPRIIAVCDKPQQLMYFTITFRSFTPVPGGLEFRPGQDYYFISTSGPDPFALTQKMGGRCATHNMKVIFKVCCGPAKVPPRFLPTPSTTSTILNYPTTEVARTRSTTSTTRKPLITTVVYRFQRPTMPPYQRFPPHIYTSKLPGNAKTYPWDDMPAKVPSKKTEDRDKLPNETRAKNEELVKSDASATRWHHKWLTTTTTTLLLLLHYYFLSR